MAGNVSSEGAGDGFGGGGSFCIEIATTAARWGLGIIQ
ncbi:hypothetical protein C8N47_11374 [Mangrovibacterium marinum]|uniref:Uncharacterized protein n=1 Tax=Mangrovibacterium marinum TaxID=1639118 RepID=A0A2T5BZU5_9BACT|nr:hypothetical protein C8N47_11374 [Mangrovibacterium marinum]